MSPVHSSERLHKLLAQHGLGSRREIEKWMQAGRILLNGRPAQPGERYTPGDRIVIDGKDVTARLKVAADAPRVIIYHKPQGQPITPSDEAAETVGERSVMESLPAVRGARWLVVNTMQAGDSGLLLLTSDGRLADALRRRAETTPAAYVARVLVPAPEFDVASMPRVVQYDEDTIEFESIEPAGGEGTNRWFRVESHRAHRRAAVRALFESRGLKVSRVIQVQFADLELPRDLPRGKYRALSEKQVKALYARAELAVPEPEELPARDERPRRRPPPDRRRSKSPHKSSQPSRAEAKRPKAGRFGSEPERRAPSRSSKPPRPTGNRRSGR
jgi:23S rRNA pseudouridine2605 synthase